MAGNWVRQLCTILVCILMSGFLSACTELVSGSRSIPVKVTDYEEIHKITSTVLDAPLITAPIGNRPVRIYKVAFDGTLNDHARIPSGERGTLVARIAELIQADIYYPGAGMQGSSIDYFDAATGRSSMAIAADAEKKFYAQARIWLKQNPETDIRVFVTGFSRGAATARHFINIVSNHWGQYFNSDINSPRFYALLYDTVATGQQDRLILNIPQDVDYLVHFVAIDEARNWLFIPTIDEDKTPLLRGVQFFPTNRINTIYLPGSHSDIGASYSKGIGDLYITLTDQFLYMMGLAQTNCWENQDDPLLAGKHDSRGGLDILFGSQNPNTVMVVDRPAVIKETKPLTIIQRKNIALRLNEMWVANFRRMAGMYVAQSETSLATITLRKSIEGIVPVSVSNNIKPESLTLSPEGNAIRLRFKFTMGKSENSLLLKPKVTRRIKFEGSKIAFGFLESPPDSYMATWVDNRLIELTPMTVSSEAVSKAPHQNCVKQLDGTFRSPIRAMILNPN